MSAAIADYRRPISCRTTHATSTAAPATAGALLIIGLDMWMRGRRHRTVIAVPEGIVTAPKPMSDAEVAEFKRRWREAYADGRGRPVAVWPGDRPQIDSPGFDTPDDQPR
jgi:hypothetical protein